jgi:hypothetical protein
MISDQELGQRFCDSPAQNSRVEVLVPLTADGPALVSEF